MNPKLAIPADAIARFCRAHAVRQLALFGSATTDHFTDQSDVDVLIDLKPETRVGLVALQRMRDELVQVFGRPVDLVTREGLNPRIREEVQRRAEVLYAE